MSRAKRLAVAVLLAALVAGTVPLPPPIGFATRNSGATPIPNYLSCVVSIATGGADPNFSATGFPLSCVFAVFDLLKSLFGGGGAPERRSTFTCHYPDKSVAWQQTIGWTNNSQMQQRFAYTYNLCKSARQEWISLHPEFFGSVGPPVIIGPPQPPPTPPVDPCDTRDGCISNPNYMPPATRENVAVSALAIAMSFQRGGSAGRAWWQAASGNGSALRIGRRAPAGAARAGSALGTSNIAPRGLPSGGTAADQPTATTARADWQAQYQAARMAATVNPRGGSRNCVNCSIAADALLSGRPASALLSGAKPIALLEPQFGGKFVDVASKGDLVAQMVKAGPGARGIVFGDVGPGKRGHVFNVVNRRGVILFIDAQAGEVASFKGYYRFKLLRTN